MFVLTKNKFIKGIKEIKINFQEKIKEKIKPTKKDILKINNNVEFKNSLVEFMCFFLVGAIVVFEGGASGERDNIPWMVKYGFPRITDTNVPYEVIDDRFPSLSMIKKI
jgi:hypothetical protein